MSCCSPVVNASVGTRDACLQAQTEIFIRACSAVESKLEHVVEELKKDRFLGDSDWPVVWRWVLLLASQIQIVDRNKVGDQLASHEIQGNGNKCWSGDDSKWRSPFGYRGSNRTKTGDSTGVLLNSSEWIKWPFRYDLLKS